MTMEYQNWNTTKLGKPFYFFFYYIPKRYTDRENFSEESINIQHHIWNFKDGYDQTKIANIIIDKIKKSFNNLKDLTFVCIPASTKESNNVRYRNFSETVCNGVGMYNAFEHIQIDQPKTPKHLSNEESYPVLSFDEDFFRGKNVIIFDDVVTKGNSMKIIINYLEPLGAKVAGCLCIGKTYYDKEDPFNPAHPWSSTKIRPDESLHKASVAEPEHSQAVVSKDSSAKLSLQNSQYNIQKEISKEILSKPVQDTVIESKHPKTVKSEDISVTPLQYKFGDIIELGAFYNVPLKWEVLEQKGNNVLLISKYGVTCRAYNDKLENTSWSESSLRKWLNEVFYERSFSEQEKKNMIRHLVNAEVVSGHELNPGENTKDFVHILSIDDYMKFYDNPTHHWKCRLLKDKKTEKQCWLRNYGYDRTRAAFIGRSGRIHYNGSYVDRDRNTVRPVILIKI